MSKVDILLLPPLCEVCDQEVTHGELSPWHEKHICTYCLSELTQFEEATTHVCTDQH